MLKTPSDKCDGNSNLFVQYICEIPQERDANRRVFGLAAGSIAVFIYLFSVVYFDYIACVQMNKFVDFDVKTITAGDYTLEFELNKKHFDHFIKNYYDDTNPMGEVAQLKLYIQLELEKRFNEMDSLGLDGPAEDDMTKKVEIAQITFAYDNAEVIEQLTFRGIEVKGEAWGNVEKINDKILKMVQK